MSKELKAQSAGLLEDLIHLVESSKRQIVINTHSSMTVLFWSIGKRISVNVLNEQRAEYGKEIVVTVSRQLQVRFGRTYEEKNLRRMIQLSELYPKLEKIIEFEMVLKNRT